MLNRCCNSYCGDGGVRKVVFLKKDFLNNWAKLTKTHLSWSLSYNNLSGRPFNYIYKETTMHVSSSEFCKIFTAVVQESLETCFIDIATYSIYLNSKNSEPVTGLFHKNGALENEVNFTGKYLCQIFLKLISRCYSVKSCLIERLRWLFPQITRLQKMYFAHISLSYLIKRREIDICFNWY